MGGEEGGEGGGGEGITSGSFYNLTTEAQYVLVAKRVFVAAYKVPFRSDNFTLAAAITVVSFEAT